MADHGKNRKRSHFARARQRRGNLKAGLWAAAQYRRLKAWRRYWCGSGPHPDLEMGVEPWTEEQFEANVTKKPTAPEGK